MCLNSETKANLARFDALIADMRKLGQELAAERKNIRHEIRDVSTPPAYTASAEGGGDHA